MVRNLLVGLGLLGLISGCGENAPGRALGTFPDLGIIRRDANEFILNDFSANTKDLAKTEAQPDMGEGLPDLFESLDDLLTEVKDDLAVVQDPDMAVPPCYMNSLSSNKDLVNQKGACAIVNGVLECPKSNNYAITWVKTPTAYSDFIASVDVKIDSQATVVGMDYSSFVFRFNAKSAPGSFDPANGDVGYAFDIDHGDPMTKTAGTTLEKAYNGRIKNGTPIAKAYDEFHRLEIKAVGNQIDLSVDGKNVLSTTDNNYAKGHFGFAALLSSVQFKNFSVCKL